jgi:hypothetical protein
MPGTIIPKLQNGLVAKTRLGAVDLGLQLGESTFKSGVKEFIVDSTRQFYETLKRL